MTFTSSSSENDPAAGNRFSAVTEVLKDAIAAGAFPGCAFGALAGGYVVLQGALGRFTYADDAPAVEPHTVYDVASVTKVAVTTALAMLLYQRGQLDLDMPLGDILPGFVVGRPAAEGARHVTLRHLLAHNSGLPGYVRLFETVTSPAMLLRACLQLPLEAQPGTRTEYSDMGYILLGKALEVLARTPLHSLAVRELFEPLGMRASCFNPRLADRSLIPPTENDDALRHRIVQGEVQDENAWLLAGVAGHAGLFSNVPDLLRLAREILAAVSGALSLFTQQTVEQFAKRQPPAGSSRALGWDTPSADSSAGNHFSMHSIGHLGYSGCSLWIDLDASVAAVLLTNRTWPSREDQQIRAVRPAFHNALRQALAPPRSAALK